jgi:hypothetical protein
MSIPAQENTESCAVCGKPGGGLLTTALDYVILCDACIDSVHSGKAIAYWCPSEPEPALDPEERFLELFKAACALLREGIEDENVICPTLALANAIG